MNTSAPAHADLVSNVSGAVVTGDRRKFCSAIIVLDKDFEIDAGELTPSFKIRRNIIYHRIFERRISGARLPLYGCG